MALWEVHGLWGGRLYQEPPKAFYTVESMHEEKKTVEREGEEPVTTTTTQRVLTNIDVPLEASDLNARLVLDHRKRGLMWFATYGLHFQGSYTFRNTSEEPRDVTVHLELDTVSRTYDGLRIIGEDGNPIAFSINGGTAQWKQRFKAGQERRVDVSFRTRGTESWRYSATPGSGEARNFRLRVSTDFPDVDFPLNSVSPSKHAAKTASGTANGGSKA